MTDLTFTGFSEKPFGIAYDPGTKSYAGDVAPPVTFSDPREFIDAEILDLINQRVEVQTMTTVTTEPRKAWYVDMHWRHKIRFWIASIIFFGGWLDAILNLVRLGVFSLTADGVLIISGFGLLGTATFLAIDAEKENEQRQ